MARQLIAMMVAFALAAVSASTLANAARLDAAGGPAAHRVQLAASDDSGECAAHRGDAKKNAALCELACAAIVVLPGAQRAICEPFLLPADADFPEAPAISGREPARNDRPPKIRLA